MSWREHILVYGKGAHDTQKGREGDYATITLGEVFERRPTAMAKLEAEWVIPSSYAEPDARSHSAQRARGSFVALVSDIDSGNHSADDIDALIVDFFGAGVATLIYSTSSATANNRKWRIVIALAHPQPFAVRRRLQCAFYDFMEANGVVMDRSLLRPGQVFYLPNVAPDMREGGNATGEPLFYDGSASRLDGRGVTPEDGLAPEWMARVAEEAQGQAVAQGATLLAGRLRSGPIAAYNASNPLSEVLMSCGYEPSPSGEGHWRSPNQKSGSYATRAYRREDGTEYWVSLSGSDDEAGVGRPTANDGARFGDAFDLLMHYRHGGDFNAALRSLQGDGVGRANGLGDDLANGEDFAAVFRGQLLRLHETGGLLRFDPSTGWTSVDAETTRLASAKAVVQKLAADAAEARDDAIRDRLLKRALRAGSNVARLRAMTDVGFAEPGMSASVADFDASPALLGVRNGVLDLNAGTLGPHTPDLRVSKRANVVFDQRAACPVFEAFLEQVQPEAGSRRLLRQLAGVMLSNGALVHRLVFMHGYGANGKSTFMEMLAFLMGDYAAAIPTETLMHAQRSSQGASPDLMLLRGARLAFCNETGEGRRLDAALVKQLTGGDTITARPPYGQFVSFRPSHLLVMTGNHKPLVDDTGAGLWRRMLLIDWPVTIPEDQRDCDLPGKLRGEAAGILNWALEGLRDFMTTRRLAIPQGVAEATDDYRSEQDILGGWIEERLVRGDDTRISTQTAYNDYRNWCADNGFRPMSKTSLSRRLAERGVPRGGNGRSFYLGVSLPDQSPQSGLAAVMSFNA